MPCQTLSMAQAAQVLRADRTVRLLDVRTPEEFKSGHIPGSVNLPLDKIGRIESLIPDKTARIFVYCHSGARSQMACRILSQLGYENVTNIGGIVSWRGPLEA